jgi:hypothetical protein
MSRLEREARQEVEAIGSVSGTATRSVDLV